MHNVCHGGRADHGLELRPVYTTITVSICVGEHGVYGGVGYLEKRFLFISKLFQIQEEIMSTKTMKEEKNEEQGR